MIRFTARTFRGGGTEFANALIAAARPIVRQASERCGRQAQVNILSNIAATTGTRKGKARSEPLADAARYPYRVNTSSRGAQLTFRVDGSAAFKAKFGALNYGSGAHSISGARMGNRADTSQRSKGFFAKGTVIHPGTSARRFYEEGIQEAVDAFDTFL